MNAIPRVRVLPWTAAAALVVALFVVLAPENASAAGTACEHTYTSAPSVAIPDNNQAGVTNTIDVPEDGLVVVDVDVTLNVHHTFDRDLSVFLQSFTDAGGGRHRSDLMIRAGQAGDNILGVVLDDEAALPVSWGSAPFAGRFKGEERLSTYDGESGGKYTLTIVDNAAGDTGTLDSWSLTFRYQACDFDFDGVEDHADHCLGLIAHTTTGCPVTSRSLTAKYKHGKFRGALSSPVSGCEAHRAVRIWKVRSGADKVVGTTTTRLDGTYRLARSKHVGKYYATSSRVAVTDVAECPGVQSPTIRLR
jgi:subtilisin-like proprotein convertase family protein